jgi:hypothetical protein
MEDALTRLDRLAQEEARMAAAQVRKVANIVGDKVKAVDEKLAAVVDDSAQYVVHQSSTMFNQ